MLVGFIKLSESDMTWDLQWKTSRLPDAAFHLLGSIAKMRVAIVHLGPGVENADGRLALEVIVIESHLLEPGAVSEAALIVRRPPTGTAKSGWIARGSIFGFRHKKAVTRQRRMGREKCASQTPSRPCDRSRKSATSDA
jgi:hypothetical protein